MSRTQKLRLACGSFLALLGLVLAVVVWAQERPLAIADIKKLAQSGVTEKRLFDLVKQRGISFAPTPEALDDLRKGSVPQSVLEEIENQVPRGQTPDFYLREGDRLAEEGHYDQAVTNYQKIFEQLPDDPGAKARIARVEERRKQAEAEDQRRELEAKERRKLPYYRQQLQDALQRSDCEAILIYGQKILRLEPGDASAKRPLGQCAFFTLTRTFTGHDDKVSSVTFSPDSRLLASGSLDHTVKLRDTASGTVNQTLTGHSDGVISVAFSPNGHLLTSGSIDGTIKLWDVRSGALKQTLNGQLSGVLSVVFSPDGRLLASGNQGMASGNQGMASGNQAFTVNLWKVTNWTLNQTFTGNPCSVTSVAFSPDGRLLASGSCLQTNIYEVATGALKQTLSGQGYMDDFFQSVAFSPDGRLLASGSADNTIKLWEVASGTLKQTLSGHDAYVHSVAFSSDSKLLASGSEDRTIKLWEVASGTLRQTLSGHTDKVLSVAFSPDGRVLASGSADKTIKLWERAH